MSVLNPSSWSTFLPPQIASEVQIETHILTGVLGAFAWDILNNIPEDRILIARRTKSRLPKIIYIVSKLSTFTFVVSSVIFRTAPMPNCVYTKKAVSALLSFALPSTALLFFLRARAVFSMNPFAVPFFGVLWLGVLAGCLTTIPGISGVNIGPTSYCITGVIKTYSVAATVTPLINDGIIFFAISWRLCHNTLAQNRTVKNGVRTMVFGDHLPVFSRSMLQDGQIYFLTTVAVNILSMVVAFATSVTTPYRLLCTVPNAALMNVMACRVYRRMALAVPSENFPNFLTTPDSGPAKTEGPDNVTIHFSKTVETMV